MDKLPHQEYFACINLQMGTSLGLWLTKNEPTQTLHMLLKEQVLTYLRTIINEDLVLMILLSQHEAS